MIFCPKMGGEAGKKIEELGILNLDRRGTREGGGGGGRGYGRYCTGRGTGRTS